MQFIFLLSNLDGLRLAIENFLKFFYDFFYDLGTRMAAILTYSQPFAPIRTHSQPFAPIRSHSHPFAAIRTHSQLFANFANCESFANKTTYNF